MRLALSIGVGLALAGSAWAASKQDWQDCRADHPDRNIAGCTRIIESRKAPPAQLAAAYYSRGSAYGERSDYTRALADYSEAIRLNPKNYEFFVSRGLIYEARGEKDRAIADYSEAIRLNPMDFEAFTNRGLLNLFYARQRLRGQRRARSCDRRLQRGDPPVPEAHHGLLQPRPCVSEEGRS